jgi:HK97 family phage prohead protease
VSDLIVIDASALRTREKMRRKYGASMFRDGRRFAKSEAVRDDIDDEPRLAIEGIAILFDELILNKHGNIIIFEPTAFDNYVASGKRPPVWLQHDPTKVVCDNAELCLLNVGLGFRIPLTNSSYAATAKEMIESGDDGVSIGFTELKTRDEVHFGHSVKRILEAEIRESSICPRGACKNAFARIINANAEPPLHESVSTTVFGIEFDLHSVKRLIDDNQFNLRQLKRDLLLLEDNDAPVVGPVSFAPESDFEKVEGLQKAARLRLGLE